MTESVTPERLVATLKSLVQESSADPLGGGAGPVRSALQSSIVAQPAAQRLEFLQQVCQYLLREIPVTDAPMAARPAAVRAAVRPAVVPTPQTSADAREVGETFRAAAMAGALGIRDPGEVDPQRLQELAEMWQAFTLAVDNAVRTIWREIAKHASEEQAARAPAPAAISNVAASYVRGDGRVSREEVERQLDLLRRLISSILMGLAEAGKQRAQEQVRIFGPDSIKKTVRASRHKNLEAECWRQYEMLVKSHHAADIQAVFAGIQSRLADYVIQTLAVATGANSRG